MIVIPALDLREGACVQLEGGRYDQERVRRPDPLEVARSFRAQGFRTIHVVDLDAATGRGSNTAVVRRLLAEPGLEFQAGGGVRTEADAEGLLQAGAARVIAGTRAVTDPEFLAALARAHPQRIMPALDVREREVVTHGWTRATGVDITEALERLAGLPLAGVLVTAVHREGALAGTDFELLRDVARQSPCPLHVAGGISTIEELRRLAEEPIAAAVLGMALYTGAIDPARVGEEFVA